MWQFWKNSNSVKSEQLIAQGDWLVDADKNQEAVARFTEAIALDPKSISGFRKRGLTYFALAQYQDALSDFDRCIELEPDPYAYLVRGTIYLSLKEYQKTIQDCTIVLSKLAFPSKSLADWFTKDKIDLVTSHRFLAHITLARADFNSGNLEGAAANCSKALVLRPEDVEALVLRTAVYKELGRPVPAHVAPKRQPRSQNAKNNFADSAAVLSAPKPQLPWHLRSKFNMIVFQLFIVFAIIVVTRWLGIDKLHWRN